MGEIRMRFAIRRVWVWTRAKAIENIGTVVAGVGLSVATAVGAWIWALLKTAIVFHLPANMVVASLVKCDDLEYGKWSNFDAAGGRFIIGGGTHAPNLGVTQTYEVYAPDKPTAPPRAGYASSVGGEEKHKLKPEEMPTHGHPISTRRNSSIHDGLGGSLANFGIDQKFDKDAKDEDFGVLKDVVGPAGGDEPHPIIPPYVSLYYCKKE